MYIKFNTFPVQRKAKIPSSHSQNLSIHPSQVLRGCSLRLLWWNYEDFIRICPHWCTGKLQTCTRLWGTCCRSVRSCCCPRTSRRTRPRSRSETTRIASHTNRSCCSPSARWCMNPRSTAIRRGRGSSCRRPCCDCMNCHGPPQIAAASRTTTCPAPPVPPTPPQDRLPLLSLPPSSTPAPLPAATGGTPRAWPSLAADETPNFSCWRT